MVIKIPVVFSTDENFLIPTAVSIESMMIHADVDTYYDIFILIDELFDINQKYVIDNIQKKYENCKIEWRMVNREIFSNAIIVKRLLTINTFYKLIIADVLKEYDKCIYLDGDILVERDLKSMYFVDLGNDYIAAVRQDYCLFSKGYVERMTKKLGVDSLEGYFFAGDLVINLKKIREENVTKKFLECLGKGYLSEDQDILFKCCKGKVKYIPLTYTLCNRYINESKFLSSDLYSKKEIRDALQHPAIIHFAGGNMKPWNNLRCKAAEKWWSCAKRVLETGRYKEMYSVAERKTKARDFDYLLSCLEKSKDEIIIFGYSIIGKQVSDDLIKHGYNVRCFFDNNEALWGDVYNSCLVEKPGRIDSKRSKVKIILAAQGGWNSILPQLYSLGYGEEDIVKYDAKNSIYYMGLDEKFYEYELREIAYREYGKADGDIKEKFQRDISYLTSKYYMDSWNFGKTENLWHI